MSVLGNDINSYAFLCAIYRSKTEYKLQGKNLVQTDIAHFGEIKKPMAQDQNYRTLILLSLSTNIFPPKKHEYFVHICFNAFYFGMGVLLGHLKEECSIKMFATTHLMKIW